MSTVGPDAGVDAPAWRLGLADAVPLIVALAPIGCVAGAVGAAVSGRAAGWAAGPLLVSGTAHFAMLSLAATAPVSAVAVGVVVSLRCLIYSAALAPDFAEQPRWFRVLGAYLLFDQVFALVEMRREVLADPDRYRRYYLAMALPTYGSWLSAMAVGAVAGTLFPEAVRLELAVVALVVAMLRPALTTPTARVVAATAGATTVVAAVLPHGTALVVGAAVGMFAGARADGEERT